MSSEEIQSMFQIRRHLDDLRSACDTGQEPRDEVLKNINEKIDMLLEIGLDHNQIWQHLENWREINRVTTESPAFDLACKLGQDYVSFKGLEKEGLL